MDKPESSKYDIAFLSLETWSINLNWMQTTFLCRRVEFINEGCQQTLRDLGFKTLLFFSVGNPNSKTSTRCYDIMLY